MELFKGYVQTKNKRALRKWKDQPLLNFKAASEFDEFAGVLNKNTICLDCDNSTQSEILLKIVKEEQIKCRVIATTKGKHFYFCGKRVQKCMTNVGIACGLTADFKVGASNSYAVLKYGGVERVVEYDTKEYEELPLFLSPVGRHSFDFVEMKQGDGRNSALFSYILTLQRSGFDTESIRKTISIINEYVMEDRLDDDEVAVITRDGAFKEQATQAFFDGSKFLHDKFAEWLAQEEHIRKINGQLHIYCDGVYLTGFDRIEAAMIKHISILKETQRKEVVKYLGIYLKNENKMLDARYLAFNNGILDLVQNEILDFTPELLVTNKIDHDYDIDAYCELTDRTLDKLACNDRSVRLLIEECCGYCLYRRNEMGKAFIFLGDKRNGKSTMLAMVAAMLGTDNISSLDMQELGDRFNTAMLHNKLANIGDDISDDFMRGREVSLFKKIVTGNRIKGEIKGQTPFEFEPYVKLLFSANTMPRTKDMTGAVARRLIIVPFNAVFSETDADYDPFIKYKLCQEDSIKYLLRLAVDGLARVLGTNQFTKCESVEREIRQYELENNPALQFVESLGGIAGVVEQVSSDIYVAYTVFCAENGYAPLSKIVFSRQLKKNFGLKLVNTTRDGQKAYIYRK